MLIDISILNKLLTFLMYVSSTYASLSRVSHKLGISQSPSRPIGALRGYSRVTPAAVSDTNLCGQGSRLSALSIVGQTRFKINVT